MAGENDSGKTHATFETGGFPLCLLYVLHILFLVFLFFLTDKTETGDVLILRGQFSMAANDCVADFLRQISLLVERELWV
jgi:hypothetical protein